MADSARGHLGDFSPLAHPMAATQNDHDALQRGRPRPNNGTALWHRLGAAHLLTLSLGSVVLPLGLLALGLLWKESMIATSGADQGRLGSKS